MGIQYTILYENQGITVKAGILDSLWFEEYSSNNIVLQGGETIATELIWMYFFIIQSGKVHYRTSCDLLTKKPILQKTFAGEL